MIYTISDLHLSLSGEKPMDIFGDNWAGHEQKIRSNWLDKVEKEDIVLVPGDISWALKLPDAMKDLEFLQDLPGKKIFVKGNHDLWWSSLAKIRALGLRDMHFIQNDSLEIQGISFCGTRGWNLPEDGPLTAEDEKIYRRELKRLELSLESAAGGEIIALLHFPPFARNGEPGDFVRLLEQYPVRACVYGHIHNRFDNRGFLNGVRNGIHYQLASCDYLGFDLTVVESRNK